MENTKGKIILLKRTERKSSCAPIVFSVASTSSARTYDRVVLKKRKKNGPAIISRIVNPSPKKFFVNSSSMIPRALAGFLMLLLSVNPVAIVYATEAGEVETEAASATVPEEKFAENLFEETSGENENNDIEPQLEVFSTADADLLATTVEEHEDGASDMEVTESAEETVLDNEEISGDGDEEEGEKTDQTQNEELPKDEQVIGNEQDEEIEDAEEEDIQEEDAQTEEDLPEETAGVSGDTDEDSIVDDAGSAVNDTETEDEDETEGSENSSDDEEKDTTEDEDAADDNEMTSTADDVGNETDGGGDNSTQANNLPDGGGDTNDGFAGEEEDQEVEEGDDNPLLGGGGNETGDEEDSDIETNGDDPPADIPAQAGGGGDDIAYPEDDEAEDENFDEGSVGEEDDTSEEDETEDVGDGVVADDQENTEESMEQTIDEALIRAEIEKVVEARIKKEYEEKVQEFLEQQQETIPEEIQNFQSTHSFDDAECEVLSDNEIYCRRDNALIKGDDTSEVFTGVFAQESGDDSEIVFQHGGQIRQITDNDHSDINPVYDEKSDRIVWQALISGRWQIMTHDLAKGITEQVSGGGFNNINPHIFDDTIAWQGWAGSNWDIFYAQYSAFEDQTKSWRVARITDNTWPDVGPRIVEGIVLWEAHIGDSWQIFSYEIDTDALVQVSQGRGNNRNPRFVVLWDSIEDGVAQTIQYNISTNERSVVGTEPAQDEDPFSHIPESPINENQAAMPIQGGGSGTAGSGRPDGDGSADE